MPFLLVPTVQAQGHPRQPIAAMSSLVDAPSGRMQRLTTASRLLSGAVLASRGRDGALVPLAALIAARCAASMVTSTAAALSRIVTACAGSRRMMTRHPPLGVSASSCLPPRS